MADPDLKINSLILECGSAKNSISDLFSIAIDLHKVSLAA